MGPITLISRCSLKNRQNLARHGSEKHVFREDVSKEAWGGERETETEGEQARDQMKVDRVPRESFFEFNRQSRKVQHSREGSWDCAARQ